MSSIKPIRVIKRAQRLPSEPGSTESRTSTGRKKSELASTVQGWINEFQENKPVRYRELIGRLGEIGSGVIPGQQERESAVEKAEG